MLKQRVITAVLLLAVLLPALLAPTPGWFLGLSLLLVAAGVWEWGRLNGLTSLSALPGALAALVAGVVLWDNALGRSQGPLLWLLVGAVWVALGVWSLQGGAQAWVRLPVLLRRWGGWCLLLAAWWALAQAHVRGLQFLLSLLALVWVADVGAYFAGRAWGGRWFARKLAPAISPGKTWEGALGGLALVLLLALCWSALERHVRWPGQSLYGLLLDQGWVWALLTLTFLTAMSVVGDLVESLVKRVAQVKDSSGLLPGHGGVLDRLDALLPTVPMAMMLVQFLEQSP